MASGDWTRPPRAAPQRRRGAPPPVLAERAPTSRELQVLDGIARGLTNAEIAGELFLSEETIKSHVRHLLSKLQAKNRAHLVARGFELGLLSVALLSTGSQER